MHGYRVYPGVHTRRFTCTYLFMYLVCVCVCECCQPVVGACILGFMFIFRRMQSIHNHFGEQTRTSCGTGRGVKQSPAPFAGRRKCLKVTYKRRQKMAGANRSGQANKKIPKNGPVDRIQLFPIMLLATNHSPPHTHQGARERTRHLDNASRPRLRASPHKSPASP